MCPPWRITNGSWICAPWQWSSIANFGTADVHLLGERIGSQDLQCLADMAQFMSALSAPKAWALKSGYYNIFNFDAI